MSEFKVGDRVKIIESGFVGEIFSIENRLLTSLDGTIEGCCIDFYEVVGKNGVSFSGLQGAELELIEKAIEHEKIKTQEQIKIEQLEQRIEKLEKEVFKPIVIHDRPKENVSNLEKMTPKLGIKDFKDMIRPNKMVLNTNDPLEMIWNSTEEEPKPSLLTEDERVILRNLDKKWKWIARDEGGILFVYEEKPERRDEDWMNSSATFRIFNIFSINLFQFISWEDDEPYNIEELLKGGCGNE